MVKKIVLGLLISINVNSAQPTIYTTNYNECMKIAKGIEGDRQCDLSVNNRAVVIKTYIHTVGLNEVMDRSVHINILDDTMCLGFEQGIYSCSPQGIKE